MIDIKIKTDGEKIYDQVKEDVPTLNECALVVFRLEEIKQYLLSKEFKSELEISEGDCIEDED